MSDLVYKIILAGVLLLAIAVFGYYVGYDQGFERAVPQPTEKPLSSGAPVPGQPSATPISRDETVFCTQDAMECPDGSFVGRVGLKCEFAPCPGT